MGTGSANGQQGRSSIGSHQLKVLDHKRVEHWNMTTSNVIKDIDNAVLIANMEKVKRRPCGFYSTSHYQL